MQKFLESVAEVLEVASVRPEDDFRTVPMWGSLTAFALMVMFEQRYGKTMKPDELAAMKTVADLAKAVGVEA